MLMIQSSKPRKQRLFRYNAANHLRQRFVHAHVAKELASKLGIKRRNVSVRRGDTIKVMSGAKRGKTGKVLSVDLGRAIIFVEGITRKNAKGRETQIPISASNVYITEMDMSDKLRASKLHVAAPAAPQTAAAAAKK
ncbi:MAG: 50S ribosomal protein L24 [Candidatus Micrarchaeota archaeon]|nr:50S ribosomal protein L24 [Candidatus Micrarchaeota archaeon]